MSHYCLEVTLAGRDVLVDNIEFGAAEPDVVYLENYRVTWEGQDITESLTEEEQKIIEDAIYERYFEWRSDEYEDFQEN